MNIQQYLQILKLFYPNQAVIRYLNLIYIKITYLQEII